MMHVIRLSSPTGLPFDLSDVAAHIRVEPSDAEALRQALAAAAEIEHLGSLALLSQVVQVTLSEWTGNRVLPLPIGPVPADGTAAVTIDDAPFTAFTVLPGLRPALRLFEDPPTGVIVIEYQAGFGAGARSIPADLRLAIMDQAAAFYDLRGPGDGKSQHLSPHAARIVARYRRVGL